MPRAIMPAFICMEEQHNKHNSDRHPDLSLLFPLLPNFAASSLTSAALVAYPKRLADLQATGMDNHNVFGQGRLRLAWNCFLSTLSALF